MAGQAAGAAVSPGDLDAVTEPRRAVEVGITDKGLALMRGLDVYVQRMPKALLGHLGVERLGQLGSLLEAMISDLGTFP